ncbi:MAG: glycosyltransferase, partial [Candidatus Omnitrophica bacterium]|nr:glycosyltransferase [Candidatus Omnitrophota bacterium]
YTICILLKDYFMSITVLYLLHRFSFGGTERLVVNLLNNSSPNIKNYVCSFKDADKNFLDELITSKNSVISLNKNEGNDITIPRNINALCNDIRVDIIHSLGWATYVEGIATARLFRTKRKFIFSYRGKTISDTVNIPKRRLFTQKILSYFCNSILTNSEVSKSEYANEIGISPAKISVIYNGVDVERFGENVESKSMKKRKALGIKKDDIVVGSVARFDPVKNLDGLVRAFSNISSKIMGKCRLLLVGDGPDFEKVKKLSHDLGLKDRVVFTGMRRDIPECLGVMNIYAQPSRFENIPNSILEAMAAGLPVVATSVGGIGEVVENKRSGFLVPLGKEGLMTQSIAALIENKALRLAMGKHAREKVCIRFSLEKMVLEYEQLYAKIAGFQNA